MPGTGTGRRRRGGRAGRGRDLLGGRLRRPGRRQRRSQRRPGAGGAEQQRHLRRATMTYQQLAMSQVRAVEHDRAVDRRDHQRGQRHRSRPTARVTAATSIFDPRRAGRRRRSCAATTTLAGRLRAARVGAAGRRTAQGSGSPAWRRGGRSDDGAHESRREDGTRRRGRGWLRPDGRVSALLVIIPTYNERENLPLLVSGCTPPCPRPTSCRRRRQPGRHRRAGRRAGRWPTRPRPRACTAPARTGSAPRTWPGSPWG